MAYCTQSDILEQLDETTLTELTDDAGEGEIDEDKVDRAIADADATIDSYCRSRYTVPLDPVPGLVRSISVDIAIYRLYLRRRGAPDHRKERYDEAVRFLKDVSNGRARFDDEPPARTDTGDSVDIDYNDRIFTRDKMSGF